MCNAFVMRKGKDVYYTLLYLSAAHIHPLYTGDPECGFDIAIVQIKQKKNGKKVTKDHFNMKDNASNDLDDFTPTVYSTFFGPNVPYNDLEVQVAGYPLDSKGVI